MCLDAICRSLNRLPGSAKTLASLLLFVTVLVALEAPLAGAQEVEEWPLEAFPEPSGIVYHPLRRTLFVVGDEGDIGEVDLTGKLLRIRNLGGDLEGVTCNPGDGRLYVAREGHDIVFEVDPQQLTVSRRFTIDRTYDGNANFLERGGDGIEGITFVPGEKGGQFFVVNQYDPPALLELGVPLAGKDDGFARATIVHSAPIGSPPLSDVVWDPKNRVFLVVSALWRSAYVIDGEGRKTRAVRLPGIMQEGLALLPDGSIVIAQDTGGLIRWKPAADPFTFTENRTNAGQNPVTTDTQSSR